MSNNDMDLEDILQECFLLVCSKIDINVESPIL